MHILSCIEDKARYSLHLYSQVLSHVGREIPWFTEIYTRPLDQQRGWTSWHPVGFIHLHLRNLDLLPLLVAACLARPVNHTKHQLGFVIYPHQSRVSSRSLKLYKGKGIIFFFSFAQTANIFGKINKKNRVYAYIMKWKRFLSTCRIRQR